MGEYKDSAAEKARECAEKATECNEKAREVQDSTAASLAEKAREGKC